MLDPFCKRLHTISGYLAGYDTRADVRLFPNWRTIKRRHCR
jgi:hypothetical protein